MSNTYDVGDVVRITATFTDSAGLGVDPSSVYAWHQIIKPTRFDVTTIGYGPGSITRVTTGTYFTDLAVNSSGEWHYRFRGYGANAAAVEGQFKALVPIVGA